MQESSRPNSVRSARIPSHTMIVNPDAQTISDVTGLDLRSSLLLLNISGGDVQLALSRYYEGTLSLPVALPVPATAARPSSQHNLPTAHVIIANPAMIQNHPYNAPPPPKKGLSNFSIFLAFLVLLMVLAGIGVGVYVYLQHQATNAINSSNGGSSAFQFTSAPTCVGCTRTPTLPPSQRFIIDLNYLTNLTGSQQQLFEDARARWESVIPTNFQSAITVSQGQQYCSQTLANDIVIQNLYIFVTVKYIDGVGGILGKGGPCGTDSNNFVRIGEMIFDSADIDHLIQLGTANSVILHEMAHVLGFGTLWDTSAFPNLITPSSSPTPYFYFGAYGNQGNADVGASGNAVVEDTGGQGTARGHWKETVYPGELMTGYIGNNGESLSKLTALSMKDLGYPVNDNPTDAYSITSSTKEGK